MKTVGWRLVGVGNGQVQWEEIPDSGACPGRVSPAIFAELIKAAQGRAEGPRAGPGRKGVSRAVP